jgi:hypothetical protein
VRDSKIPAGPALNIPAGAWLTARHDVVGLQSHARGRGARQDIRPPLVRDLVSDRYSDATGSGLVPAGSGIRGCGGSAEAVGAGDRFDGELVCIGPARLVGSEAVVGEVGEHPPAVW